jgi:TRAP-type mannitol/chloroaromatic compound transport system permease large subunit
MVRRLLERFDRLDARFGWVSARRRRTIRLRDMTKADWRVFAAIVAAIVVPVLIVAQIFPSVSPLCGAAGGIAGVIAMRTLARRQYRRDVSQHR